MSQKSRPVADVFASGWTPTPVAPQVDEVSPDLSSFVTSSGTNPSGDTFEVKLAALASPDAGSHVLTVNLKKTDSGTAPVDVVLLQGATVIGQWSIAPTTTFDNYPITLTNQQVEQLTDYSDLRVRLTAGGGSSSSSCPCAECPVDVTCWVGSIDYSVDGGDPVDAPLTGVDASSMTTGSLGSVLCTNDDMVMDISCADGVWTMHIYDDSGNGHYDCTTAGTADGTSGTVTITFDPPSCLSPSLGFDPDLLWTFETVSVSFPFWSTVDSMVGDVLGGTLSGGTSISTGTGMVGQAMRFSGGNFGMAGATPPSTTTPCLFGWFKFENVPSGSLANYARFAVAGNVSLAIDPFTSKLVAYTGSLPVPGLQAISSTVAADNTWYFIIAWVDSNVLYISVNGATNNSSGGTFTPASTNIVILEPGQGAFSCPTWFDHFGYFDGTPNQADITTYYSAVAASCQSEFEIVSCALTEASCP